MSTVLVIEDDADLRFLYNTALSQSGFSVAEAHNVALALSMLSDPNFVPELVILDMGMPDSPGTRAINFMRGEPRFNNTQIVIVTANEQYRERVADKGVSYFMVKPVEIAELVRIVTELAAP
ncbi:MAG TPA: response regulator [Aggregatilineales bacterium]|nr:response regulator [Aggregatilineales bacterium]